MYCIVSTPGMDLRLERLFRDAYHWSPLLLSPKAISRSGAIMIDEKRARYE